MLGVFRYPYCKGTRKPVWRKSRYQPLVSTVGPLSRVAAAVNYSPNRQGVPQSFFNVGPVHRIVLLQDLFRGVHSLSDDIEGTPARTI